METGYDILFFWVARMIMSGLEFTGEAPFHTVYLHGLIRDEHGQKMSKTKGNVIDPLIVMDEFGTDALRFTLLVGSTPGKDMNLSVKKVEANRNFANKVWNAGRFVFNALEKAPAKAINDPAWSPADEYIHARMRQTVRDVNRLFDSYQFGEAGRQIYEFFWSEFADWYIETAKSQLNEGGDRAFYTAWTLVRVLDKCLRMLHPFTPFVTEELWGLLKKTCQEKSEPFTPEEGWSDALIIARWPVSKEIETWEQPAINDFMKGTIDHVRAIRSLKTESNIPVKQNMAGTIIYSPENKDLLYKQKAYIESTGAISLDFFEAIPNVEEYKNFPSMGVSSTGSQVFLKTDITGLELDRKEKISNELGDINTQIERLEKLLASDFGKKAPPQVILKENEKLEFYKQAAKKLHDQLD
jgi:valyl-tRNA synthetase